MTMGDHADDMMFEALKQELRHEYTEKAYEERAKAIIEKYKMGIAVWTNQQGEELPLCTMSNSHIHNTIKFLKRKPDKTAVTDAWIYILETEETKRQQQKEDLST